MNIAMMCRTAAYFLRLCLFGSTKPEQIDFYPQKLQAATDHELPPPPPLVSPESVGVASSHILEFLHTLENDPRSRIHNLLIYRDGRLISTASAPGYSPRIPSQTNSMAKTVTAFAVGCLIGEGRLSLDTRIADIFSDELPFLVHPRTKKITIRHLLSMTAGVTGVTELAAVSLTHWRRAFLSSAPSSPGKHFFYNSLNSYMLAAAVEKITGRTPEDYLREHIFDPLGITAYEIEEGPEGIAKGGWGMYITPVDMGKLGNLLLSEGVWQGKRILPADFVREMTRSQIETSEAFGDYNYGLHMWVARNNSSFLLHGMQGQHIWVSPASRMVIVATCENDEFYQDSNVTRTIDRFFGNGYTPAEHLRRAPFALRRLRRAEQNFFCTRAGMAQTGKHSDCFRTRPEKLPREALRIAGEYEIDRNNIGILPLYCRILQNNHSAGISRISFRIRRGQLFLAVTEGTEREIPCGFRSHAFTVSDYRGERYLIGARGTFSKGGNGALVLRLDLIFPELACSRRMRLLFRRDGSVTLHCSESPGIGMLYALLDSTQAKLPRMSVLFHLLRARMGDPLPQAVIRRSMEPVLHGKKCECDTEPTAAGTKRSGSLRKRRK